MMVCQAHHSFLVGMERMERRWSGGVQLAQARMARGASRWTYRLEIVWGVPSRDGCQDVVSETGGFNV